MKKILIRSHMSPFDNWSIASVLAHDRVGTNAGNMIFINSIIRALMTEDVQIDTFNTRHDLTPEHVRRYNEEYSCVILPFANAFRPTFEQELRHITAFIRRLKIPCIVVGVGISATFLKPLKESNVFDDAVREFVKAVLEKSAVLGTRGQVTSDYLTRLGFREGSEHRVIGCPSMFWYGRELPRIEKKELTPSSAVSVNWKIDLPGEIHTFMRENIARFSDFQYVPQITDEMRLMYYGTPFPSGKYKTIAEGYPSRADHPWYCTDRARAFVNVPSWLDYLRGKDFSFGSRIHGNIAAVLAGTPCYVIVSDYRIAELAEYHNIPKIDYYNLKESDTIFSLYEKADYSRLHEGHAERFENYTAFLEENGLDHIFRNGSGVCPYDRKMAELDLQPALTPFFSAPPEEQARRLQESSRLYLTLQSNYSKLKSMEQLLRLCHLDGSARRLFRRIYR